MKKIKYLILIIVLTIFAPVVYAENLSSFSARADFAYNIDQSKINSIIALMEIPGEEDFREIELKRTDLYHFESSDIPVASQFDSAYVEGDKTGTYVVTGKLTKTSYKTGELVINVSLANNGSTTTTTTTAQEVGGDDIIIIGDDGKVETTQPTSDVSNITISSTKETTISKAAKERQELYKYVIFVVLGLIVFVVLIVIVKVIRTSNLM